MQERASAMGGVTVVSLVFHQNFPDARHGLNCEMQPYIGLTYRFVELQPDIGLVDSVAVLLTDTFLSADLVVV